MTNEEKNLMNHFRDLSVSSDRKGIHRYSGFLNLPEQDLLQRGRGDYAAPFETFGGFDGAERVMAAFGSEECYDTLDYPISVLEITPLNEKFAGELTHRDYLGAIMGLGLERDRIGDIVIKGKTAVVYCVSEIADYLAENISSIGRTQVSCSVKSPAEVESSAERSFQELIKPLASERLDAAVAELASCSRGLATDYIAASKVFLNQRLCESNSAKIKAGDIITIRGIGKFRYEGVDYVGKKGKLHGKFLKYT